MRVTPLGKVMLVMLVCAASFGGYRAWQSKTGGQIANPLTALSGGKKVAPMTSEPVAIKPGEVVFQDDTNEADGVDIPFLTTPAKKDWVVDQIAKFNEKYAGKYRIVNKALPSREGMHAILSGTAKPLLWSPGSQMWPNRLAEAWSDKNSTTLLDMSDPQAYRVFLRSPLVFITTKEKANFLTPLLSSPQGWENVHKLSLGQIRAPWGRLKYSYADPTASSSGILTLGLIMAEYAGRTGASDLTSVSKSSAFWKYVNETSRSYVYDADAKAGTTKLTKAFISNPSRYDVITGYEGTALEAAKTNPNIAVIYPNPTAVSEHAVTLLNAPWASEAQKAGALEFVKFLGGRGSLQDGLKSNFRPAQASGTLTLAPLLQQLGGQGFRQTFQTSELPPYEALNSGAFRWKQEIGR